MNVTPIPTLGRSALVIPRCVAVAVAAAVYLAIVPISPARVAIARGVWSVVDLGPAGPSGARSVDIVGPLDAPPRAPFTLESVPVGGGQVESFRLEPFDVLTPDARVTAVVDGREVAVPRPESPLFKGTSPSGARMVLTARPGSYFAIITKGVSSSFIMPSPAHNGPRHVFHEASRTSAAPVSPEAYCTSELLDQYRAKLATWQEAGQSRVVRQRLEIELMVDVNNSLYVQAFQSNLTQAQDYAQSLVAATSDIYERDVDLQLRIGSLTVWTTSDPFGGGSSSTQLNNYRTWCDINRSGVSRDLAHLLANGNVTNFGGIAYLDVLCDSSFGYAVSNIYANVPFPYAGYYWDIDVFSHETGHNIGSPHTHCYSPPIDQCYGSEAGCYAGPSVPTLGTIMSYCHLTVSGNELRIHDRVQTQMRSDAEAAPCLQSVANPGSDTIGVYDPSTGIFYLRDSNNDGPANAQFAYGAPNAGWQPIVGDWDGDGDDTAGVYDPATGIFYLRNLNNSGVANLQFGYGPPGVGWKPIAGDWDGDGDETVGLYDPSTGIFYLKNTNSGGPADLQFGYGPPGVGWVPLSGDWDGDGDDSIGLYNAAAGIFYLKNANSGGPADYQFVYGPPNATPVAGDWDRNKTETIGVYVPGSAVFYLRNSNTAGFADAAFVYGPSSLTPLAGDWDGV